MKIPINLASQPFRRDRAMIVASAVVSGLLVITLGILISLARTDSLQQADVRRDIDRLNTQIRKATLEQSQLDAVLRKPENAEVLEQSVFLNALLVRKGISWTKIFADLETVVPYNARIIQIRPSVSARDQVSLDMMLGAESQGPLVDLVKAMQSSPVFSNVEPKTIQPPTQSENFYRFRVNVDYAQKL